MRAISAKWMSCIGAAALVVTMTQVAAAQCGLPNKPIQRMNWRPMVRGANPWLLRTSDDDDNDGPSIVGMWHVKFTATQQNGQDIPGGGAVIDNSMVVWHHDGTEIMNSSRSAQDGNFCLGVWKRTGKFSYQLNHIPWAGNIFDPSVPPNVIGPPQAGVQILEYITLDPSGKSYSGTFTLTGYDTTGNVYIVFKGTLAATRVTPDTPFSDLL